MRQKRLRNTELGTADTHWKANADQRNRAIDTKGRTTSRASAARPFEQQHVQRRGCARGSQQRTVEIKQCRVSACHRVHASAAGR
jgi:hypothetical protein